MHDGHSIETKRLAIRLNSRFRFSIVGDQTLLRPPPSPLRPLVWSQRCKKACEQALHLGDIVKSTRARRDTTARAGERNLRLSLARPLEVSNFVGVGIASNEDRQAKCDLALAINLSLYRLGWTQLPSNKEACKQNRLKLGAVVLKAV